MQAAALALVVSLAIPARAADVRAVKSRVAPIYPEIAKRMRIEGEVRLEVTVDAEGKVTDVKTVSGNRVLSDRRRGCRAQMEIRAGLRRLHGERGADLRARAVTGAPREAQVGRRRVPRPAGALRPPAFRPTGEDSIRPWREPMLFRPAAWVSPVSD